MDEEIRRRIATIIDGMTCQRDFICAESGFSDLCNIRKIGLESFLECLEKDRSECQFRIRWGASLYCSCPLRVYIARRLNDDPDAGKDSG